MKRLVVFLLCLLLFTINVTVNAQQSTDQNITKYFYDNQWHEYTIPSTYLEVNGEKINTDMPPIVLNDRSVVPARAVFEKLGATVTWDEKKSLIGVSLQDTNIELTIDNKTAVVNGQKKMMDVPSKLINSRTMIPVRFVAETLGAKVDWNESNRIISIWYQGKGQAITNNIKMNDIQYSQNDDILSVKIIADHNVSDYSISEWKDANKLIININNAINNVQNSSIEVNKNKVQKIRSSQYELNPYVSRVVIDLSEWTTYEAKITGDGKQLQIDLQNQAPSMESVNNGSQDPLPTILGITLDPKAKDKIVVIDPGHGGSDPGALGKDGNGSILVKEKDLNLSIGEKVVALLKEAGVTVYTTREDDSAVDLSYRSEFANKLSASLFVSVHNNAMEQTNYGGTMVLYHPSANYNSYGTTSKELAQFVQDELVKALGTTDRGLRDGSMMSVIRKSTMPAIIAEVAFVTNPSDRTQLMTDEFRTKAAEAIFTGIIKTLNESVQ